MIDVFREFWVYPQERGGYWGNVAAGAAQSLSQIPLEYRDYAIRCKAYRDQKGAVRVNVYGIASYCVFPISEGEWVPFDGESEYTNAATMAWLMVADAVGAPRRVRVRPPIQGLPIDYGHA